MLRETYNFVNLKLTNLRFATFLFVLFLKKSPFPNMQFITICFILLLHIALTNTLKKNNHLYFM